MEKRIVAVILVPGPVVVVHGNSTVAALMICRNNIAVCMVVGRNNTNDVVACGNSGVAVMVRRYGDRLLGQHAEAVCAGNAFHQLARHAQLKTRTAITHRLKLSLYHLTCLLQAPSTLDATREAM